MKKVLIPILMVATVAIGRQHIASQHHWELTDSETLWIGRYSNCQYGYYSLLPTGMVAHAEHPPAPHHGFLVSLPDISLRTEVTVYNSNRYLWVNGEYNTTEESTLAAVTDYQIALSREHGKNFKVVGLHSFKLRSVPATRHKAEYQSPRGQVVEDVVVVLRSGVVYELGLKTPAGNYAEDREKFDQVLAGIRFTTRHNGQCWNE